MYEDSAIASAVLIWAIAVSFEASLYSSGFPLVSGCIVACGGAMIVFAEMLSAAVIYAFQHKAFTEVFLDDSHSPANRRVSVQVATPALHLSVRFPIPDLRSDQERGPWFKKSLQKETLHLAFTDLESQTEFVGGSTPEQTKLELTFRELTGKTERTSGE